MVDCGSVGTFIRESTVKRLKLVMFPKNQTIPLATDQFAVIVGQVIIDISFNGVKHEKVVVDVIKDLCSDLIIGRDLLSEHQKVVLNWSKRTAINRFYFKRSIIYDAYKATNILYYKH